MTSLVRRSFFIFFLAVAQSYGQTDVSRVQVSDSLLRHHVYTLADKSLKGRETGTEGQVTAALYCIQSLRQNHLSAVFRVDSISGSMRQPFYFDNTPVAIFGLGGERIFASHLNLVPAPTTRKDSRNVITGHNIAGLLPGTDLKQEVLIVSAHYDHIGRMKGQIHPGADDNASGTAAILSVAAVFDSLARQGIRSRRSILFVLFSGEEQGLLGSKHFVSNSPIPLQQIICDLNVDMVGRVDDKHRKRPDYCYVIGNKESDRLRKAVKTANMQSVNIELDYEHDFEDDPKQYFYRSDQYNFARYGIPALFLSDGEHPDYHQPTDTPDKINYDVLKKRATLLFQTAWLLAN